VLVPPRVEPNLLSALLKPYGLLST
jgi:hypothetical protein